MNERLKSKKNRIFYIGKGVLFLLVIAILMPIIASGVKPISAFANSTSLKVSVKQILLPALNQDRTFTYKLEALEAESPMPRGSKGNGYVFSITGNGVSEFSFSENVRPGRYSYRLFQVIEEEVDLTLAGVIYDRTNYRLELLIDSEGAESLIAYCEAGSKVSEIYFENDYTQKEIELPPPEEEPTEPKPTEPNKPAEPRPTEPKEKEPIIRNNPGFSGKRPITGDTGNMFLWFGITGGAAAVFTLALILLKKKKENNGRHPKELIDL